MIILFENYEKTKYVPAVLDTFFESIRSIINFENVQISKNDREYYEVYFRNIHPTLEEYKLIRFYKNNEIIKDIYNDIKIKYPKHEESGLIFVLLPQFRGSIKDKHPIQDIFDYLVSIGALDYYTIPIPIAQRNSLGRTELYLKRKSEFPYTVSKKNFEIWKTGNKFDL